MLLFLAALSATATALVNHFGWTLYYGDAEAHLNIARRILDSRTPGYDQIGTVWLPLPHLLTLVLVMNDRLWRTGLAGAIPASACFVIAGAFLFTAMRSATESTAVALASLGLFALNPNLLYLQAAPMTEPVFLAALMALLYFTVRFRSTQSLSAVIGAAVASLAASLTRYEGWFLIPFVTLYFLLAARRRRAAVALLFGAIAALAPLFWLGHNWWLYSNPLEFFNGPFSAKSIYQRQLDQHMTPYPGDHNWASAVHYFSAASLLSIGWGATSAAVAGLLAAVVRKPAFWPIVLGLLPPLFYVWSMHSGGTPIFVPALWPNTYYNTRYGLAALPLVAIAGGSVALLGSMRIRALLATLVIAVGTVPWLLHPQPGQWASWEESRRNSEGRRAWTKQAASILQANYETGTGIFTSFGDLIGIFREAGIPIREALHDGNVPEWMSAVRRPDLFLHARWVVAMSGDIVAATVQQSTIKTGPYFRLVQVITVRNSPGIEIYRQERK